MSGPKTYHYEVDEKALYEARNESLHGEIEMQMLGDLAECLEKDLQHVIHALREAGFEGDLNIPQIQGDSIDALRACTRKRREMLESLKMKLLHEQARQQNDLVLQVIRNGTPEDGRGRQYAADILYAQREESERDVISRGEVKENEVLRNAVYEAEKMARNYASEHSLILTEDISRILASIHSEQDPLVIKVRLKKLNDALKKLKDDCEKERKRAADLLSQLPEWQYQDVQDIRAKLRSVVEAGDRLTPDLNIAAERLLHDVRRRKAVAAAHVVRSALEEMGYDVEPITESMLLEGGNLYLRNSEMQKGYFVRMRVDPENSCLSFNMVRTHDESSYDLAMERAWCSSIGNALEKVAGKGVKMTLKIKIEPGDVAVQKVDEKDIDSACWKSRRRTSKSRRNLDESASRAGLNNPRQ